MLRYRRKSETVRAEQFIPEQLPWPDGMALDSGTGWHYHDDGSGGAKVRIKPGSWIVTNEATGVRYTINNEIFQVMYEPIVP